MSRNDLELRRLAAAAGWGAGFTGLAILIVLASQATGFPLPFPGVVFLLAAVLAAYFAGLEGGFVAALLTMATIATSGAAVLGALPDGTRSALILGFAQLVATVLVGLMKRQVARAVRQQVAAEAQAAEAAAAYQAEQTLRLVVDNIPQRVFWKDMEGRYLGCNAVFARDAGFASVSELIGKTDFDTAWKQDAPAYRADDASVAAGRGAKIGYEEPQHQPDGSVMWLRTSKVPMLDRDGRIIGVLGTYEDTTEQRRREEQLRIAANAQEFALEGVVTLDLSHRIVSVNQAFTSITGYTSDEVVGRNQAFLRSEQYDAQFYKSIWETTLKAGRWQGEVWRRRKDGSSQLVQASVSVVRDGGGFPTHYVMVFNDISKARADAERIAFLAYHDSLTGLANRAAFTEAIRGAVARSERDQTCLAVLYLDLDAFKPVNDSLGHAIGDELLQQVGARLSTGVRKADVVARLGGDEFAILLEGVGGSPECVALADKLLALLAKPYRVGAHELFIAASIGISLSAAESDEETLLRNADLAMYEAKHNGKGRYHVFSHNLDAKARRSLALTNQLHLALERGELSLHYQPKVSTRDMRIVAFEALMRWTNAEMGPISPAEFIPVAEQSGLIDRMGDWALRVACAQARQWVEKAPDLIVCVNVSARQLRTPDFTQRLAEILAEAGLHPGSLELEITESVMISEPEQAIEVLLRIRDMGVGVALDDFGTGFSSLSYLKQLPVKFIKIDRSFIRELPDNAEDALLVRGILALAKTLDIGTVAEGVETEEQRVLLRQAGCELAQGYLFARPLPAEEAGALLGIPTSEHRGVVSG